MGVARLAVAAEGDELNVVQAGRFDAARGDQPTAVAQQHDLEHDARVVGAGTGLIVAKACIQGAQVQLIVDQVIERELGAGLDLLAQHHRQEPGIAINGLVSGHVLLSCFERLNMDSTDGYSFRLGGGFCTASTFELTGAVRRPVE